MARFINPFTDVGFKRIFGQEINKDLLIDFLNALLVGERCVKDIHFLDKELLPEFEKDRGLIYDIYCTDETGEQFIVEMQNKEHVNFRERTLFYLSQAIARQGEKGASWRFSLKAVYGVFFLNFSLTDLPRKLRTDIVLSDRDSHELFTDKMRFIFLELPSFNKEESECETDFERWIYVLKNMETLQRLPFKARNAVFQRLEQIVDIASMSKEDRVKYDAPDLPPLTLPGYDRQCLTPPNTRISVACPNKGRLWVECRAGRDALLSGLGGRVSAVSRTVG